MPGSSPMELINTSLQDFSAALRTVSTDDPTQLIEPLRNAINTYTSSGQDVNNDDDTERNTHSLQRVSDTDEGVNHMNNEPLVDDTITSLANRPRRSTTRPDRYGNHIIQNKLHRWSYRHSLSNKSTTASNEGEIYRNSHINATVLNADNGNPLKWRDLARTLEADQWRKAEHEEFLRLIETTETMSFIRRQDIPRDRKTSYYNPQPQLKFDDDNQPMYRIRGTYGGDQSDTPADDRPAYMADMTTTKLLWNSVISTPGAKFMSADIKDFYLGTVLSRVAYMKIHRRYLPHETIQYFDIDNSTWWEGDYIYVKIVKGIYGLPEAGKLAQEKLYSHLSKHGYNVCSNTPGLIRHQTRPIMFTLVVDDFGIQYLHRDDAVSLITILEELYIMKVDWSGVTQSSTYVIELRVHRYFYEHF
jgi:hypothetical protein